MYKIICIGLKNEFFLTSIVLTSNSRHYERAWMAVGRTFGWFHWQIDVALVERLSGWRKVSNTWPSQTAFSNANPPSEVGLGPARLHWCGIPEVQNTSSDALYEIPGAKRVSLPISVKYIVSPISPLCGSATWEVYFKEWCDNLLSNYIETTCPKILCFIQDRPSPLLWQEMM